MSIHLTRAGIKQGNVYHSTGVQEHCVANLYNLDHHATHALRDSCVEIRR